MITNQSLSTHYPPIKELEKGLFTYLREIVIAKGMDDINPYELSDYLGINDELTLSLLFLLTVVSKEKYFYIEYVYTDPNAHVHYLRDDELENYYCEECDEEYNLKRMLVNGTFNVPIKFKIQKEFMTEIKDSFMEANLKGGASKILTSQLLIQNVIPEVLDIVSNYNGKSNEPIMKETVTNFLENRKNRFLNQ